MLSYGSWTGETWTATRKPAYSAWRGRFRGTRQGPALRLFRTRVDNLARAFSHPSLRVPVSEELNESLERDGEELPSAAVLRRPHREWEPLRTKLGFVHHRLGNTLTPRGREPGYADAQALRRDIELVLAHVNSRHVALGSIRRLLWQIDVFGFHLAGIDIRQGAGVVREATGAILPGLRRCRRAAPTGAADRGAGQLTARDRVRPGRRGRRAAARARHRGFERRRLPGPQAVPAFVISMTEQPSDVLAATWLAHRAGATAVRMVPLFETRAALEEAPATMAELYACEPYVAHLRTQANRQTVMVGYSDSGKDTGYIGSSWALHNAQEELARAGHRRGHLARALPRPRRLAVA